MADEDEIRRLAEIAEANAKKHAKVIEDVAKEGMHKQQLEAQRPQKTQTALEYERQQAAEAKREAIRLAARANEPGAVAREAAREENNRHVLGAPNQPTPQPIAEPVKAQPAQAPDMPAPQRDAANEVTEPEAQRLRRLVRESSAPLVAALQKQVDELTAQLAQERSQREALYPKTERAQGRITTPEPRTPETIKAEAERYPEFAKPSPYTYTHEGVAATQEQARARRRERQPVTLPTGAAIAEVQEAARLRREQQAATAIEQRDRRLEGQHAARRKALGAERWQPVQEATDRAATRRAREGAKETSDRAAREQNRELSSEATEQRQSRRNNGKSRDNERDV